MLHEEAGLSVWLDKTPRLPLFHDLTTFYNSGVRVAYSLQLSVLKLLISFPNLISTLKYYLL